MPVLGDPETTVAVRTLLVLPGELATQFPPMAAPPLTAYTLNSGWINNKAGWTNITGTFVANGTETEVMLGNFNAWNIGIPASGITSYDGAYVYIDDVSITPVDLTISASP